MSFKTLVSGRYEICAKQMNFMAYTDELLNGYDLDQVFDEMYHSGGFDEKKLVTYIEHDAKSKGIILDKDIDEDALHEMYKVAEKGLS